MYPDDFTDLSYHPLQQGVINFSCLSITQDYFVHQITFSTGYSYISAATRLIILNHYYTTIYLQILDLFLYNNTNKALSKCPGYQGIADFWIKSV